MIKFNHINKIGVELEGAFEAIPDPDARADVRDFRGGVKNERLTFTYQELAQCNAQGLLIGERDSKPYDTMLDLRRWITKFFPKYNNRGTGFHVHVSFKDDTLRKKLIASKEFHSDFLAAAKTFVANPKYKFNRDMLDRVVDGKSGYASHSFNPPDRGAIHAMSHWGTCEFRLFSGSMNCKQSKQVLTWLVSFVEEYIDDHFMSESGKNIGVAYSAYNGQRM